MEHWMNEQGQIIVRVPLSWDLPTIVLNEKIGGTVYHVSGSYDGTKTLPARLLRLMKQDQNAS